MYALCNGREFVVFNVSRIEPIFAAPLKQVAEWIHLLEFVMGVKNRVATNPEIVLRPDFGSYLVKSGLAVDNQNRKIRQIFLSIPILSVAKLEDGLYSINSILSGPDGEPLMITFDFPSEAYKELLEILEPNQRILVEERLSRQPYFVHFELDEAFSIGIVSEIGDSIMENENESYVPCKIIKFAKKFAV